MKMTDTLTVDQALQKTNSLGRYQVFMAAMLTLWILSVFCNQAFYTFGGVQPSWTCDNQTTLTKNCTIYSQCSNDSVTFHSEFYSVPQEWSLVCDKSRVVNLLAALLSVGKMCGELAFGWVADSYGRKPTVLVSLTLVACAGLGASFAPSWKWLAAGEMLIGISVGCLSNVIYIYSVEFTTNRFRLLILTTGGSSVPRLAGQALIGYVSRDWRGYLIICSSIGFAAIALTLLFVHESPRWLLQKGREQDAMGIISKVAKFNGNTHKLGEDYRLYTIKSKKSDMRVWDLFRHGKLLAMFTILCMATWFEICMFWMVLVLELGELSASLNLFLSVLIIGLLTSFAFIASVLEFKFSTVLNRRRLLVGLSSGMFLSSAFIFVLYAANINAPYLFTGVALISYTLIMVKYELCFIFPSELFPTLMRANVNSLAGASGSVGAILAPFLIMFSRDWPALPYLVCCFLSAIALSLTFALYPNTNKMDLVELEQFTAANEILIEEKPDSAEKNDTTLDFV